MGVGAMIISVYPLLHPLTPYPFALIPQAQWEGRGVEEIFE